MYLDGVGSAEAQHFEIQHFSIAAHDQKFLATVLIKNKIYNILVQAVQIDWISLQPLASFSLLCIILRRESELEFQKHYPLLFWREGLVANPKTAHFCRIKCLSNFKIKCLCVISFLNQTVFGMLQRIETFCQRFFGAHKKMFLLQKSRKFCTSYLM